MPVDFTNDQVLNEVKRRINIPVSEDLANQNDFLTYMNMAFIEDVLPHYISMYENFFLKNYDSLIGSNGQIVLPNRTIGGKIQAVTILDQNQNEIPIPRLQAGEKFVQGYYIIEDRLQFYPVSFSPNNIRIWYYRRPGILVFKAAASQITNIAGNAITFSSVPTSWTTSTIIDFIKNVPEFISVGDDFTILSIVGSVITFNSTVPANLAIGDWASEQYTSPIAQIPYEGQKLLSIKTALRILIAINDTEQYQALKAEVNEMERRNFDMSSARVEGTPYKIVNRHWQKWVWR